MLGTILLAAALTRAEILERFKSPVVTQARGLVQVYANCPEDMRREYQMPIAGFASGTVADLYRAAGETPVRFSRPGIIIHVGDVRTNLTEVASRVSTNGTAAVTRIYVQSPGYADLVRLRLEVVKGFFRAVRGREISDREAVAEYRRANPQLRIADERLRLEEWLAGNDGGMDVEDGLKLMRKIIEPGRASRRDVLIFASRLFLYPPYYDMRLAGEYRQLSFAEAVGFAKIDPLIRIAATLKAAEMPVLGGGRGAELHAAAMAYHAFLLELGKLELDERELRGLLMEADEKLNIAFEKAK